MQLEDTPDPAQPDDGIGVLVHAQIDLRIGPRGRTRSQRRTAAALVATHRLTGLKRRDNALGRLLSLGRTKGAFHFGQDLGAGSMLP
jgi:hypothetical protein